MDQLASWNFFDGTEKAWIRFLNPPLNKAIPYIGMVVAVQTKKPETVIATGSILKSISIGKILSITGMHSGDGQGLRVMWFCFK